MAGLLDVPLPREPSVGILYGLQYPIYPHQAIIRVSLTEPTVTSLSADARAFPALIDTGNNESFSIGYRHLEAWANLHPQTLRYLGDHAVKVASGHRFSGLPRYRATLWLHPDPRLPDVSPLPIVLHKGFTLYPRGLGHTLPARESVWRKLWEYIGRAVSSSPEIAMVGPSLPTIGIRSLAYGRLKLHLDYESLRCTIET